MRGADDVDILPSELGNLSKIDPRNPRPEDEVQAFRLGVDDQLLFDSWLEAFKAATRPRLDDHAQRQNASPQAAYNRDILSSSLRATYNAEFIDDCHSHLVNIRLYDDLLPVHYRKTQRLLRRSMCRVPAALWSWKELRFLYIVYVLRGSREKLTHSIWLNCAANYFQHSILWNGRVSPAATITDGDKGRNPVYIIADLITVCAALAMAGSLELQTRALGVCTAVTFATLGLILYALPQSVATTSAGQVFYGIGFTGFRLLIDVLIADTTDIRRRALGVAFISSPWSITAFSVPAMRRAYSFKQLRHAIAAFAGIVFTLGLGLFAILQHQRFESIDSRSVLSLKKICDALKQLPHSIANLRLNRNRSRASAGPFWRWRCWRKLRLPLTTYSVVIALLIVFVILWLVQIDLAPWYAPIPAVALYFGILGFLVALKDEAFRKRVVDRLVLNPLTKQNDESISISPWKRKYYALSVFLFANLFNKESVDRTGDSILSPLRNRNMVVVCALAVTWKCESIVNGA